MPSPLRFCALIFAIAVSLVACRDEDEDGRSAPPTAGNLENSPDPIPVSYAHKVRPLLAEKCFRCHSGDTSRNKSGLRLDLAHSATSPRPAKNGFPEAPAVVAGDPEGSLLWQRIQSTEADTVMPPPEHSERLTVEEIELITRWINEGAQYEPHWSWQAFAPASPSSTPNDQAWNEIDHFVLDRLQEVELSAAPLADPQTLLRRVTLALTGLTPEWEHIVDLERRGLTSTSTEFRTYLTTTVSRLLNSPAFGESLSRLWLDAVQYADTADTANKFQASHWPYRDWVIDSFNRNLRIDQFLLAQLSGDLLTEQSENAIVGTNFLRLSPLTTDPTADPIDERKRLTDERVARIGQAMLGLDLRCAECHDHPADPLTTSDFAALTSLFHIPSEGTVHHPGITPYPTQALPSGEQKQQLLAHQLGVHRLHQSLTELTTRNAEAYRTWLQDEFKVAFIKDAVGIFNFDAKKATISNRALDGIGTGQAKGLVFVPGIGGSAIRLDPKSRLAFDKLLPLRAWTPWTATLRFRLSDQTKVGVLLSHADQDSPHLRGFDLQIANGHLIARVARDWPGHALGVRSTKPVLSTGHWHTLSVSYDGSSSAKGLKLYLEGNLVPTETTADSLWKPALPQDSEAVWVLGSRTKGLGQGITGDIDDFQLHRRELTELEVSHLYDGQALSKALQQPGPPLQRYYFSALHPPSRKLQQSLMAARQRAVEPQEHVLEVAVMGLESSADQSLAVPALLRTPGSDPSTPLSRREFAAQLSTHPLAARVFVNRVWAHFFGRGLVDLGSGFGLHGPSPSHPDLLEWLAADFAKHDWNVKRLCHRIVLSRTFLQDSSLRPEVSVRDPEFRLLAQGPSFPLDPGSTRDVLLAASQLLEPSTGGPPPSASSYRRAPYLPSFRIQPHSKRASPGSCPVDYHHRPARPPVSSLSDAALATITERLSTLSRSQEAANPAKALFLQLFGRLPTDEERALWEEKGATYLRSELLGGPIPQR